MTSISLFYFCKKVFALVNLWMIRKKLLKLYYLEKLFLLSPKHGKYYWCTYAKRYLRYYTDAKRVWKDFKIKKKLGNYHELHVQCDTLLLVKVFENFRNIFLEISEFDHSSMYILKEKRQIFLFFYI